MSFYGFNPLLFHASFLFWLHSPWKHGFSSLSLFLSNWVSTTLNSSFISLLFLLNLKKVAQSEQLDLLCVCLYPLTLMEDQWPTGHCDTGKLKKELKNCNCHPYSNYGPKRIQQTFCNLRSSTLFISCSKFHSLVLRRRITRDVKLQQQHARLFLGQQQQHQLKRNLPDVSNREDTMGSNGCSNNSYDNTDDIFIFRQNLIQETRFKMPRPERRIFLKRKNVFKKRKKHFWGSDAAKTFLFSNSNL